MWKGTLHFPTALETSNWSVWKVAVISTIITHQQFHGSQISPPAYISWGNRDIVPRAANYCRTSDNVQLNLANVWAKVILIGHWSDHKKKLSHYTFFFHLNKWKSALGLYVAVLTLSGVKIGENESRSCAGNWMPESQKTNTIIMAIYNSTLSLQGSNWQFATTKNHVGLAQTLCKLYLQIRQIMVKFSSVFYLLFHFCTKRMCKKQYMQ
jgi:hypothetical protein